MSNENFHNELHDAMRVGEQEYKDKHVSFWMWFCIMFLIVYVGGCHMLWPELLEYIR